MIKACFQNFASYMFKLQLHDYLISSETYPKRFTVYSRRLYSSPEMIFYYLVNLKSWL